MPYEPPEELARSGRAYLIAPAGYGKTETVAKAAALHSDGRQLILTHTHAGVRALKDRLRRVAADRPRVRVETIAGFALRYAAAFPRLSEIPTVRPVTSAEWNSVYEAGRSLLETSTGSAVLGRSYAGLFVDEYQDCVIPQHELVMAMARTLPCRIVLDPLQGIFGFSGDVVSSEHHLAHDFERLPDLQTPYRWLRSNPGLGEWLAHVRRCISSGQSIELSSAPIEVGDASSASQTDACFRVAKRGGTVVAIGHWPADCHSIARRLRGVFTVMEPIECPDLMAWSRRLEEASGPERSIAVIDLASKCMTKVSTEFRAAADAFRKGRNPVIRSNTRNRSAVEALVSVSATSGFRPILSAMREIEAVPDVIIHRRELWREAVRTINAQATGGHDSLAQTAWQVRDRGRHAGRRVEARTVSRTLLAKGLEFDHAILLDAAHHDARNLYVAMTRGSASLTVLSESHRLHPAV